MFAKIEAFGQFSCKTYFYISMSAIKQLSNSGLYTTFGAIHPKENSADIQIATKPNGTQELSGTLDCLAMSNSALVKKAPVSESKNAHLQNKEKISELKNKAAIGFFEELNLKSPEKCSLLLNNENIVKYSNLNYGIFNDSFDSCNTENIQILKNAIDSIDLKGMDDVINSLSEREENPTASSIINGIILYSNSPKAFEYVVHSPKVKEKIVFSSGYSKDLCEYVLQRLEPEIVNEISYNSLREIEKGNEENYNYSLYTIDSDSFQLYPKQVERMRNHLSQCVSQGDFTAYRGERSSWVFESVPIDKSLQRRIKIMTFLNPKSRKDLIFPNRQKYMDSPKQTIYDYISHKKEDLTLADAMLVAKYGDKKYIDYVLEKIKSASVQDEKFKSFTLNKKFANNWAETKGASDNDNMVSVITKTNIKKGNQVAYYAKSCQHEFIVNDNLKTMTFSNAKFDKETNTFYVDSQIEAN